MIVTEKIERADLESALSQEESENLHHNYKENPHLSAATFKKKSIYELEQECLATMAACGFPFDGPLITNGTLRRYSCDQKKSQEDEWYIAFSQNSMGKNPSLNCVFGSWSQGGGKFYFKSWDNDPTVGQEERAAFNEELKRRQKAAEIELAREDELKAIKAKVMWDNSSDQSNGAQAYLSRKKVRAHGLRFSQWTFDKDDQGKWVQSDTLIIPLRDIRGEIRAVQHIRADGEKRIYGPKKGHFFSVGEITINSRILVSEGYSTGVTILELTNDPLIVAVDCGNLDAVVRAIRNKYPENQILLLGDDDVETKNNPGRTKANAAAKKYDCLTAFPVFPNGFRLPNGKCPTDWNDLLIHFGVEGLRYQISKIGNSIQEVTETDPTLIKKEITNASVFSSKELTKALADNECGDAALFKKLCSKDYLFDLDEKSFYLWNGTSWAVDKNKTRYQKLAFIADKYADEAELISEFNQNLSKAFQNRSKTLKTVRRMNSVLEMATVGAISDGGILFDGKWDDCAGYLPCANGLVDLKTGRLIESSRSQYIRKYSSITFDPIAKCPIFERFVLDILKNSYALVQFLQRLIGYVAMGLPLEHLLILLYGKLGRNGKGVLVRTLSKALGHFSREFSAELLLLQRNPPSSSTPRPDLVHLQGVRMATFSEINEGRVVDSAVLKNLSGGDMISARSLFSNEIKNFLPTHTLFLQANHKPKAPANDTALWRRTIVVPFEITFVDAPKQSYERKIDLHVEEKLLTELPGILRWIVEGALEYQKVGLCIPREVRDAVDAYRRENDGIGIFLKDRCIRDAGLSTRRSDLTKAIQTYCEENHLNRPSSHDISEHMKSEGFLDWHNRNGDFWMGLSITTL